MFAILAALCGIANLVCLIIVVVKIFTTDDAWKGVVGIICGLYAFIWGWQHKDAVGSNVMLIWTVAFLGSIVFRVLAISAR